MYQACREPVSILMRRINGERESLADLQPSVFGQTLCSQGLFLYASWPSSNPTDHSFTLPICCMQMKRSLERAKQLHCVMHGIRGTEIDLEKWAPPTSAHVYVCATSCLCLCNVLCTLNMESYHRMWQIFPTSWHLMMTWLFFFFRYSCHRSWY